MNALNPISTTTAIAAAKPAAQRIATRPQDWESLNSPGHVLGARIKRLGWIALPFALVAFASGLSLAQRAVMTFPQPAPVPDWIESALAGDPATATDLAGFRTSYRYHWMQEFNPKTRGLDLPGWTALVNAIRADMAQHGQDATEWATVAELATQPRIARPPKVFSEEAARMETGIIAVPEAGRLVFAVAAVDGAWGLAAFIQDGSCATVIGPEIEGCQVATLEQVELELVNMRPVAATQEQQP